jgi:hypothetical protein
MLIEFKKDGSFAANSNLYSEEYYWEFNNNYIQLSDSNAENNSSLKIHFTEDKRLFIDEKGDQPWGIKLRKAQSFLQFFEEEKHLELAEDSDSIASFESWWESFNIYLVPDSNGVSIHLDDEWHDQEYDKAFENYLQSRPVDVQDSIKVFVFADKTISDKKLDAILTKIENRIPNRIYQVFASNIPDYSYEGIFWKVKKAK